MNMTKMNRLLSLLLLAALPAAATAALKARTPAQVSFIALGPAGLRIEGKSSDLQVTDRPDALVVTVPLAKLETGISLRDHHMREKYLESQKYPNAQLAVARTRSSFPPQDRPPRAPCPRRSPCTGRRRPSRCITGRPATETPTT